MIGNEIKNHISGHYMSNRAAIRWITKGKYTAPVIQYMLLDYKLDYLIPPQEVVVSDLKNDLWGILNKLEQRTDGICLEIYFKSINIHYRKHRKDSAQFHRLINNYLISRKLKKANSRTAYFLKKEDLRLFKDALYLLDIDCKTRGCAFVAYLWMIALKATRSRIPEVIKQIWKARFSISRMNKNHQMHFDDFYAHLI